MPLHSAFVIVHFELWTLGVLVMPAPATKWQKLSRLTVARVHPALRSGRP
jgi:hypothetical protein